MALKLNAGEVKRGDIFFVDPFQIVVREELRGREFPPTDAEIVEMAMSIYDVEQLQPIQCRRVADNKLEATAGFTRTNAVRLIREGFTGTDGKERHDPEFKIQVKVADCSDEQALIKNIIENEHRNEATDIDAAHNQEKLRSRYGHTDVEIAKIYQYHNSVKVGRLRKLLQLSRDHQLLVHRGLMGTQAAIDSLELTEAERDALFAKLMAEDGKINGAKVVDEVRDHIFADKESEDGEETEGDETVENSNHPKAKPRSIRNIRKFLEGCQDYNHEALRRFGKDMLKWVNGKSSDKAMENALHRLMSADPEAVDEEKKAA